MGFCNSILSIGRLLKDEIPQIRGLVYTQHQTHEY